MEALTNASLRFVAITSNGTTLVEGTDFTTNYSAGTITFNVSQSGNTIVANYYHNNGVTLCSEFLLTPPASTLYRIDHIEGQFSLNIDFADYIFVEVWAGAVTGGNTVNLSGYGGFSPTYYNLGYGQSRSIYRNINDLFNWCIHAYPAQPAAGNLTQPVLCLPFLYVNHPEINAKQGTLIRVYLERGYRASCGDMHHHFLHGERTRLMTLLAHLRERYLEFIHTFDESLG